VSDCCCVCGGPMMVVADHTTWGETCSNLECPTKPSRQEVEAYDRLCGWMCLLLIGGPVVAIIAKSLQ
jgi:hypothetical protein